MTQSDHNRLEVIASGKAFLFDMDGTLVDSTAVVESLWTDFATAHGLLPEGVLAFAHGRQTVETISAFLPEASRNEIEELAAAFTAAELSRTDEVVEVPGAHSFLTALAELHAPYALVTSAPARLARSRMHAAGLPLPPVTVTKEDVRNSKPHPEGYLLAASLLDIDPQDAIVFEDSPAGIEAGKRSGATVIAIGSHPADRHPHLHDFRPAFVRTHPSAFSLFRNLDDNGHIAEPTS